MMIAKYLKKVEHVRFRDATLALKSEDLVVYTIARYYDRKIGQQHMKLLPPDYDTSRLSDAAISNVAEALSRFTVQELGKALRKGYLPKRVLRYADELLNRDFIPTYRKFKKAIA